MQRERTVYRINIDDVIDDEGPRALNSDAVARLARSIGEIGMHTPIVVVFAGFAEGDSNRRLFKVASGRHRIAAVKSLGWSEIEAIRFDDAPSIEPLPDYTDINALAEMWAIAENLHRLDLSKDERDQQIRRYAELLEKREAEEVSRHFVGKPKSGPQGGRPEGIASKVAKETGLNTRTVQRALKKPPIDPEAEQERKEAEQHRREQDKAIEAVVAEEFAAWLFRRCDQDELPQIVAWIEGSKPKQVIDALHRLSNDAPVFDRGSEVAERPFGRRVA